MAGRQVNIAIVGTGFIAETRARAYAGVTGYEARLVAAVSRLGEHAAAYAVVAAGVDPPTARVARAVQTAHLRAAGPKTHE